MKKEIKPYYVLNWDINRHKPEYYNIMPYLINEFNEEKKKHYRIFCDYKEPKTFEDYKGFILRTSKYQFWSRCEYEIIVSQWPYNEDDPMQYARKIDVYDQIEHNIDVITNHFISQL